jgi:hypothetical protein
LRVLATTDFKLATLKEGRPKLHAGFHPRLRFVERSRPISFVFAGKLVAT